jgi:hypothetical protein
MNVSIMQPTYLPWPGFFNLIAQSDVFIFLDNVQFSYQSWQQRNRIIVNGVPHVLTVPVLTTGRGEQCICQVEVDESKHWRRKHLLTLRQAYARHPFGREVAAVVEGALAGEQRLLVEINLALIEAFCAAMGIQPTFVRSSSLEAAGSRSARLLELCRHFRADTYLSPCGSKDYIEQDGILSASEIRVVYQNFAAAPYAQLGVKEIVSHMSVVDVLANLGFEGGRKYVEQGSI